MCKKIIRWLFTLLQETQLAFYFMDRLKYVHLVNDNSRCSNYNFSNEIWFPLGYRSFCHHHSYIYMCLIFICDFVCCIELEDSHHPLVRKLGGRWSSHLDYLPPWVVLLKRHAFNKNFHFLERVKLPYIIIIRFLDSKLNV